MKAKINVEIEFDFSCDNKDIDKRFLRNSSEEYAEMMKQEMESYLKEEITDDDLTITRIKTEIEYIEDIPKESK